MEQEKIDSVADNNTTRSNLKAEHNSKDIEKTEDNMPIPDNTEQAPAVIFISPEDKFEKKVATVFKENIQALEQYIEEVKKVLDYNADILEEENADILNDNDWKIKLKLLWYKKDMFSAQDSLKAVKSLYKVREEEFMNTYLPTFKKDLAECNKDFDLLYEKSKHLCKFLKPNYYTDGISNYPVRNPGNADLEWRVAFYKFMVKNIKDIEKMAARNPEYVPFSPK